MGIYIVSMVTIINTMLICSEQLLFFKRVFKLLAFSNGFQTSFFLFIMIIQKLFFINLEAIFYYYSVYVRQCCCYKKTQFLISLKNIISGLSENNASLCAYSNHHCSETQKDVKSSSGDKAAILNFTFFLLVYGNCQRIQPRTG